MGIVGEVAVERTSEISASGRADLGLSDSQPTLVGGGGASASKPIKKALIPRATRGTPGELSALLGPGRNRAGTPLGIETSVAALDSGPAASAESDQVTPPPLAPLPPLAPVVAAAPITAIRAPEVSAPGGPPSPATMTPAPQSEAQQKKSAFAATIMGVARPELSLPGSAGASGGALNSPWVRPAAESAAGWERPAPLNPVSRDGGDGELTERNVVPAHVDSGPVGFSGPSSFSDSGAYDGTRTAVETARSTASMDVTAPKGSRKGVIMGVATAAAVTALGLVGPRIYHSAKVAAPAPVVSAPHSISSTEKTAGKNTLATAAASLPPVPAATPVQAAPAGAALAVTPPPAAVRVSSPAAAESSPAPLLAAGETLAERPSAPQEKNPPRAKRSEEAVARGAATKAAKAEARAEAKAARAEARLMKKESKARAKRKKAEERAARKEPVMAAPPPEIHTPAERPKGTNEDPDGTLPLTGR